MLTVAEAASVLGVGRPQIAQLLKRKQLEYKKNEDGEIAITKESVDKLIAIKDTWETYDKLSEETSKSILNLQNYVSRNKEAFAKIPEPVRIGLKHYFHPDFGEQLKSLINSSKRGGKKKDPTEKRTIKDILVDLPQEIIDSYESMSDEEILKKYTEKFSGLTLSKIKQAREDLGIPLQKIPILVEEEDLSAKEQAIALLNHDGYFEVIKGRIMDPKSVINIITIKPH